MVEYDDDDDDDDDDDEVVVVEAEVLLLYCVDEGCCKPVGIRTGATTSRLCEGVSCQKKRGEERNQNQIVRLFVCHVPRLWSLQKQKCQIQTTTAHEFG